MYEEINPSEWKPKEEGDFIEGILKDKQENVGVNNSMLYSFETSDGLVVVWGSAVLDSRMVGASVGEKVKITYKGLGEAKGGHNAPKIFKVEVDREDKVVTEKVA
jgi:hypothetical protein